MERREPQSLAEQAYAALKRDIIRCDLRPGELVIEARLAERYGMSKTPVRQAIGLLQTEGLVTVVPRRGTFVSSFDGSDVSDAFRLRMLLEPEAAVLAAHRASPADFERLEELSEISMRGDEDPRDRHETNRLFHVAIAEVAQVKLLTPMVAALHEELERYLNYKMLVGIDAERATSHKDLVALMREGDDDEIRRSVVAGVQRARDWMMNAMIETFRADRWV